MPILANFSEQFEQKLVKNLAKLAEKYPKRAQLYCILILDPNDCKDIDFTSQCEQAKNAGYCELTDANKHNADSVVNTQNRCQKTCGLCSNKLGKSL